MVVSSRFVNAAAAEVLFLTNHELSFAGNSIPEAWAGVYNGSPIYTPLETLEALFERLQGRRVLLVIPGFNTEPARALQDAIRLQQRHRGVITVLVLLWHHPQGSLFYRAANVRVGVAASLFAHALLPAFQQGRFSLAGTVAHSLGCPIAFEILYRFALATAEQQEPPEFGRLILTSADIMTESFVLHAQLWSQRVVSVLLVTCDQDRLLHLTRFLHGAWKIGLGKLQGNTSRWGSAPLSSIDVSDRASGLPWRSNHDVTWTWLMENHSSVMTW